MTIEFPCVCGKKLSVPDDAAGRRAKCPRCGAVATVPGTPPPPPPPPPTDATKMSRVDEMVDRLGAHLAESQERAPELTKLALGIGGLAIATFFLTLIIALFGYQPIVVWVLVWMPVCVAGMVMVAGMIKADHRTPPLVRTAAPVMVGISWAILWMSAAPGEAGISPVTALIAVCNAGGYAFLYWYIGRPWMAVFFPEPVRIAEVKDDNNSPPTEGSEKK